MATKFYGKAETAANDIISAFQAGTVPPALAQVFINRKDDVPCRSWSWNNQLIAAIRGHGDARGFRQWKQVGRCVKKGERAFQILAPVTVKIKDDDGERIAVVGFKSVPVFGYSQTDGKELERDAEFDNWLESLPLIDVARSWGLSVEGFNGEPSSYLGYYKHGSAIAVGVKNLSTWAHELVHAADDRNGKLTKAHGQQLDNETVAEFGATVLLEILGYQTESDRGGCWNYIQSYCQQHGKEPINVINQFLKRTCEAVSLILDTAEQLQQSQAPALV